MKDFMSTVDTPKWKKASWTTQLQLLENEYVLTNRKINESELYIAYGMVIIIHLLQDLSSTDFDGYHFLIKGGFATMTHTQSSKLFATDDWDDMVAQSNISQSVKQISQPEPENSLSDKSLSEPKNSFSESRSKKKLKRPKGIAKKTFDEIEYLDQQIELAKKEKNKYSLERFKENVKNHLTYKNFITTASVLFGLSCVYLMTLFLRK